MVCFQGKISSYKILLMISRSNKSSRKSISLYRTKRILIVDDDSDVALTFKKPLKKKIEIVTTRLRSKLKHTIILFRLFRSLIQTFYDLMFIDIHMPVMNGI
jgi:CheY-like chemotaxis protein